MSKNERRLLDVNNVEWYTRDHTWIDSGRIVKTYHLESPNVSGFAACRENSMPINSDMG